VDAKKFGLKLLAPLDGGLSNFFANQQFPLIASRRPLQLDFAYAPQLLRATRSYLLDPRRPGSLARWAKLLLGYLLPLLALFVVFRGLF